jgi:hypothetical protein
MSWTWWDRTNCGSEASAEALYPERVLGRRKIPESAETGKAIPDDRLKRLAQNIDALADKDERYLTHAREIVKLRRSAAAELHIICARFVDRLNGMLQRGLVVLDPPVFPEDSYQDDSSNLIQMNVRGRILQVEFRSTPELASTEDFRIPYIISGSVRAFNQVLLDQDLIEEQLLFYTLEKRLRMWRFFDARTYRSGPFDQDYLISLMEQLL